MVALVTERAQVAHGSIRIAVPPPAGPVSPERCGRRYDGLSAAGMPRTGSTRARNLAPWLEKPLQLRNIRAYASAPHSKSGPGREGKRGEHSFAGGGS